MIKKHMMRYIILWYFWEGRFGVLINIGMRERGKQELIRCSLGRLVAGTWVPLRGTGWLKIEELPLSSTLNRYRNVFVE